MNSISLRFLYSIASLSLLGGAVFAGQSCTLLEGWSPSTLLDGKTLTGYTTAESLPSLSCDQARGTFTCNDGSLGYAGDVYRFPSCTPKVWASCSSPTTGTWGETKPLYKSRNDGINKYLTCAALSKQFLCTGGQFQNTLSDGSLEKAITAGYTAGTCTNKTFQPCTNSWTKSYVAHLDSITAYAQKTSDTKTCNDYIVKLTCMDGNWFSGDVQKSQKDYFVACKDTPRNCIYTGSDGSSQTLQHSGTMTRYPDVMWSITGQNYKDTFCASGAQVLTCFDGKITPDPTLYPNTESACKSPVAKSCSWTGSNGNILTAKHGDKRFSFNKQSVSYPKSCKNYASELSCMNGLVKGNILTYKYDTCLDLGVLTNGVDLALEIAFLGGSSKTGTDLKSYVQLAQGTAPNLLVQIINRGTVDVAAKNIPAGFLSCSGVINGKEISIYSSKLLSEFVLNSGSTKKISISLDAMLTQSLGDKKVTCTLSSPGKKWGSYSEDTAIAATASTAARTNAFDNNKKELNISVVTAKRFDIAMTRAIDPIKGNLEAPEITDGVDGVNNFLVSKVLNVLVPLIVVLGILLALLGFYKILFASDDKAIGEGIKYLTMGVVGILIMMSAKFIANTMYTDIFLAGDAGYNGLQGFEMAQKIYEKIAFPFIKLAIYLALGALFIVLASRVVTFIFGTDEDAKKKAGTIIAWNSIGILVIIGAKQIVEFVFGKYGDVVRSVSNLGEIGSGLLKSKQIPMLYQIINWAMGLASLVILIMILVQAFQLLMNPDNADSMKKIKNTLVYIVIGIVIIGTGYLVTNFLIIN